MHHIASLALLASEAARPRLWPTRGLRTGSKTGAGHDQYTLKRENVWATTANLVEIDLLRDGKRLATIEPLPTGDFFAFVTRAGELPSVGVFAWSLRDRLPVIPVPLTEHDSDVVLNLQEIFTTTFDRAGYDYALPYNREPEPPLSDADTEWVQEQLGARSTA